MKRKKVFKILSCLLGAIIIVVIGLYLFLTSSSFLAGTLLPYVGKEIGCEIKAQSVDLSLLHSTVEVSQLRLGTEQKPFVSVATFKTAFSISSIMNGNIKLSDILVDNVAVNLNKNASGELELPFAKSAGKDKAKTDAAAAPSEKKAGPGIKLDLTNVKISNVNFIYDEEKKQGAPTKLLVSGFSLEVPQLKTGADAKIKMHGNISISSGNNISITAGTLDNDLELTLNESFLFDKLNMKLELSALKGQVNSVSLDGSTLAVLLDAEGDLKTVKVNNLKISQVKDGQVRTGIQLKATVDTAPLKISADIKMKPVSEELISTLCDVIGGYNPGRAGLVYFGKLDYNGNLLSSEGSMGIERSGNAVIMGKSYNLPPLGFIMDHNFTVDFSRKEVNLKKLNATMLQEKRNVLELKLLNPSVYCWDEAGGGFNGASPEVKLTVSGLDLKLARLFFPEESAIKFRDGSLNADIDAAIGKIDDKVELRARLAVVNLDMDMPGAQLRAINLDYTSTVSVEKFRKINLEKLTLLLRKGETKVAGLNMNGGFDLDTMNLNAAFRISDVSPGSVDGLPLSSELRKTILNNLNKFSPFNAELSGRIDASLKQKTVKLDEIALNIYQHSEKSLEIDLEPCVVNLEKPGELVNNFPAMNLVINELPLPQFNEFMAASGAAVNAGDLTAKLKVKFSEKFSRLAVSGNSVLNGMDVTLSGKRYQNFTISQDMDLQMANYNELKIASHSAEISVNRQNALRLEDSGTVRFDNGSCMLNTTIVYLNKHLLNLLYPSEITSLELNGKLELEAADKYQSLQVKGNLKIDKLFSRQITSPVSGQVVIDVQKQNELLNLRKIYLELLNGGKIAMQVTAEGQMPENGGQTVINLTSEKIDALLIQKLCASEESATSAKPAKKKPSPSPKSGKKAPASFDFGDNEIIANIDLKDITYGPDNTASVKGKITALKNTLDIDSLNLLVNGAPVNFKAKLTSLPEGINYSVTGNIKDLNLHPLLQPLVEGEMRNTQGIVESCDIDLKGDGVNSPELWDNMNGQINIAMRDISIPNEFGSTTVGRIIIIPFEVLSKIQGLNLNFDSKGKTNQALSFVNNFYKSYEYIKFNNGKMQLVAQDRRIYVRECKFQGDLVSSLTINGYAGFGSDRRLDVNSTLVMSQISAPVHITGTVDNPEYNLEETIAVFVKDNALNIISTGTEILKDGGKGLGDVLNKTLDSITKPQTQPDNSSSSPSPSSSNKSTPDSAKVIEQGVKKVLDSFFN